MSEYPDYDPNVRTEQSSSEPELLYTTSAVYQRKPWYASFWKVALMLVLFGVVVAGLLFALLVYTEYTRVNNGEESFIAGLQNSDGQSVGVNTRTQVTNTIRPTITVNTPRKGELNAPIEIIAFEDFECPFCASAAPIIEQVLAEYGDDIVFAYRDFPLTTIHPNAYEAALAGQCANEYGKFWEFYDIAYAKQGDLGTPGIYATWANELGINSGDFAACVNSEKYADQVQANLDAGFLAGVNSTPTWIVNGVVFRGVLSFDQWKQVIDAELAKNE